MNVFTFTAEEESMICIFNTSSRNALIDDIRAAMPDFDEPELVGIAESALRKLEAMTDVEFGALQLSSEYVLDDSEDAVDVILS